MENTLIQIRMDLPGIPCVTCGKIANVDPWDHESRYGHKPAIQGDDGFIYIHSGDGSFGERF